MDRFDLFLSPPATRDLDRLDNKTVQSIARVLPDLRENPFPRGKRIRKMKGKKSTFYRLRLDKFRIFYIIEGREVVVLRIIGKKDTDKYLKSVK